MIFVGMIGAFTTFSTYMLETFNLLRENDTKLAVVNFLLSNFLGHLFVVLGYLLSALILNLWR